METQSREKLTQNLGMVNNGLVQDVTRETSRDYSKSMDPALYDNHSEYSLKGIIEQTPFSQIYFSPMNSKGIQDTIRYRISQKDSSIGKIGYQSEKDIFAIMRSVYLQFANSSVLTDDITKNIRGLNEKVIEYSVDDIGVRLEQYKGYLNKVSQLPVPMEHPQYLNKQNFTYDTSNLI
jgi:hypothetical protein